MSAILFSKSIDEERKNELEIQSYDMMKEFTIVLTELKEYLSSSSEEAFDNIDWILDVNKKKTIFNISQPDVESKRNVAKIIGKICCYSSFFNYEIVERIINAINFENGKIMMSYYKEKFRKYAMNRVIECPTCLKKSDSSECHCYIFLDDSFKDCRQIYLTILKKDISTILKKDIKHFSFHGVSPNSVIVIFQLNMLKIDEVFPLSDEELSSLKKLSYNGAKICQISCGFFEYKINMETKSEVLRFSFNT